MPFAGPVIVTIFTDNQPAADEFYLTYAKSEAMFARSASFGSGWNNNIASDMNCFCALDSGNEAFLTTTEAESRGSLISLETPLQLKGKQWDQWQLDRDGRVCIFKASGDGMIGLKTELLSPENGRSFEEQLNDSDECRKKAQRSDYMFFKDSQVPEWFALGKRSLGFKNIPSFDPNVFDLAFDDNQLLDCMREVRRDKYSAIARGHLCFVFDRGFDTWHILRDSEIVRQNCSLSHLLEVGSENEFFLFVENVRRETSAVAQRSR